MDTHKTTDLALFHVTSDISQTETEVDCAGGGHETVVEVTLHPGSTVGAQGWREEISPQEDKT